ncbi:heme ABC transporter ATP-binding protein [Martelella sp. HB161492]|uniref:heme ABC transporter ATP-binding protein n=1 Tax=Martelella sp. HB161492 TaxID=2720726 RepID=UPI001590136E|nr:heme ABC transporter ATP-binding protein [Martelella sp. HB161492]
MITAENLTLALGGRTILNRISLSARSGALTAICGPNGCGKTTTLRALSGELDVLDGQIAINDMPISGLPAWRLAKMRGVLPQSSTLAFPFTVAEVLAMGLAGRTRRQEQRDESVIAGALKAVDLTGFEGRFYQELSGGEQQRVQFARVLCQIEMPVAHGKARWLMLDEPVASLDILHQIAIMRLARDFCAGGGGVIAVMHDLNLTALYADHIILMREGRIIAAGSPADVLTDDILFSVFGARLSVNRVPADQTPFVLPHSAA